MNAYADLFPPCTRGPGVGFHFYSSNRPDRCMHCGEVRIVPDGFNVAPHYEPVQAPVPDACDVDALVAGGSKLIRTPSERETLARELLPSLMRTDDPFTFYAAKVQLAFAYADEFIKQRDAK